MDLSPDQEHALTAMLRFADNPDRDVLTLGGYAGCGKTTIVSEFAQRFRGLVAYAAFTGRAASILKRKFGAIGIKTTRKSHREGAEETDYSCDFGGRHKGPAFCDTIHRLLKRPVFETKTDPETKEVIQTGRLIGWTELEELDRDYDIIVVDEASMIDDDLLLSLKRHGCPILAVGDHGQLPPVRATGSLMRNPDLRLEKIHRQAAGNPILDLAEKVRTTGWILDTRPSPPAITFRKKSDIRAVLREAYAGLSPRETLSVATICWMNKSRVLLNALTREARGINQCMPVAGETLICLRNQAPVFNGMRGIVTEDAHPYAEHRPWVLATSIEFPDEEIAAQRHYICGPQLGRTKTFDALDELQAVNKNIKNVESAGEYFDFGYALTCHKAQGSQFDHVILWLDRQQSPGESDWHRWCYTAVTRAAKRITIMGTPWVR
jgi:exodeoxyribonuclease-5